MGCRVWQKSPHSSTLEVKSGGIEHAGKVKRPVRGRTVTPKRLTFEVAMRHVANQEGGYVNDPNDAGGKTFKGISTTFYRSLVKKLGYRDVPVWMLTKKERIHIYFKHFWVASGADRIEDPALALQVFDHAVNASVRVAGGLLKKGNTTPRMYRNARITYYKQRPQYHRYGKGWTARANRTYQKGLQLS